jgi:glucose-6-phosphate 1-dehydrogenase
MPGMTMHLQKVNMRFDYREAFEASGGTGYEVLLFNIMLGDATLFSRTDLVETAWQVAQPILDYWAKTPPTDFPNYPAGSWGPKAAFELIERDGRRWMEVINRDVLDKVPLFKGLDPVFLRNLAIMLQPVVFAAGEIIYQKGAVGDAMYFICRGQAEIVEGPGKELGTLGEGDFFGELALVTAQPRSATIRAVTACNLFVLERADFTRVVETYPQFVSTMCAVVKSRYKLTDAVLREFMQGK